MPFPITIPILASGRAHSNAMRYFRLCANALVVYRSAYNTAESRAKTIDDENPLDDQTTYLFEAVEDAAVLPVVLGAMCLESALFDLGSCLYGDEFAARIDKLDAPAKFSVIKQLVDREEPDAGSITHQTMRSLAIARNRLIHHKSIPFHDFNIGKVIEHTRREREVQRSGIDASFRSLVFLSTSFDGNIFEELQILPSFKREEYWKTVVPIALHKDVRWCLQANTRQRARK